MTSVLIGSPPPEGGPAPHHVIGSLRELLAIASG